MPKSKELPSVQPADKEVEAGPIKMEDFELTELEWEKECEEDMPYDTKRIISKTSCKIIFKEQILSLDAEEQIDTSPHEKTQKNYDFNLSDSSNNGAGVLLSLGTDPDKDEGERIKKENRRIISVVLRDDPQQVLPKGLGMELYKKMFNFLEFLAKKDKQDYCHRITQNVDFSRTPLSVERWNELFLPIIKEQGYKQIKEDTWEKIYKSDS